MSASVLAQLSVRRGRAAVEFYERAFGAVIVYRVGGTTTTRRSSPSSRSRATQIAAVSEEHGWRLGRIADPFGHHWEIGRPLGDWPPG